MQNSVKYIVGGLFSIVVILGVWYFRSIFIYICIAAILSLITKPIVDIFKKIKIKKFRVGNGLAALLTILLVWVIIGCVFVFIIPLISSEFQYLSNIDTNYVIENSKRLMHEIIDPFRENNPTIYEYVENQVRDVLFTLFNISQVKGLFSSMLGFVGGTFISAFSITFILFFFLKEQGLLLKGLLLFIPVKYEENVKNTLASIKRLLRRYFIGILIQTSLICILVTTGFLLIGMSFNHAAAIGVLCGMLNVIPYVGPLIGFILGLVIGSVVYLHTPLGMGFLFYLLLICIVYGTIQLIDNVVFQPVIFSNSVMAHPLEIFIVILMAGFAFGIVGMFLAIPVYTILRVIAREFFSQYKIVREITGRM